VPNFIRIPRREGDTHGLLGSAFHHVLALFVETGGNGVVLFKGDKQRRQWRLVVVTGFDVIPGLLERKPGEPLNTP
jgi:hypothetical protein